VRVRAVLASILGSVTVLVIGWQAGAAATHNTVTPTTAGSASTPSASGTSSHPASSSPAASAGTFVGSTVNTRFGPVQVEIVVSDGKIIDVKALQLTNRGGRSVEISNVAAPILRKEVLAAQSAKVDSVGGATYTTDGYLSSLQSALDKANL
jgi:uncharacterized protein with FMN-binding domain